MADTFGLGDCPRFVPWREGANPQCRCDAPRCKACGHRKHVALHMHPHGGKPGDPPYDHEYQPQEPTP